MIPIPEHNMIFESDDNIKVYPIVFPIYFYKVGDVIEVTDTVSDFEIEKFNVEVVDIKHSINNLVGEQTVTVYIKKIEEEKQDEDT